MGEEFGHVEFVIPTFTFSSWLWFMTLGDAFVLFSKKLEMSMMQGRTAGFSWWRSRRLQWVHECACTTSSAGQAGGNATISTGTGQYLPGYFFTIGSDLNNQAKRFPCLWIVCSLGVSSPKTLVVAQSPSSLPLGPSFYILSGVHALNS